MIAQCLFLVQILLATSFLELQEENKYFVHYADDGSGIKWVAGKNREVLVYLADYAVYYDGANRKRLKLISKQGFSLENIPLDNNYFYNECVTIFLEAEKYLPVARKLLLENKLKARDISSLRFRFPSNPVFNKEKGHTEFWSHGNNQYLWGEAESAGADVAIVTYTPPSEGQARQWKEILVVHEYIHMCGYKNEDHEKEPFKYCKREVLNQEIKGWPLKTPD